MKAISGLAILLVLGGCAELNSAMLSVNETLGAVNNTMNGVSGVASGEKVYNIGNKSAASYEIKGLKMGIFGINPRSTVGFSGRAGAHFKGTLKNKTNTKIGVSFSVPVYNNAGQYTHSIATTTYAPAGETAIIDKELPAQIDWNSGQRPNIQKMKINIQKF